MAASTAAPSTGRSTNPGKRTATASSPRSSANPAQTGAAARSRRSAQDKSPLSQTTALPARGAKPQSTKGKAPVSTTRDLPTPAPEQQPKGKLTDSQPAVAATKPKNAPAKPRRKSLQKGEPAAVPIKADEEDDGRCPACSSLSKGDDGTWVECDECEKWYHWSCVASTSSESPDNIDKWYCSSCVAASASSSTPLRTTYKLSPLSSLNSSRAASPTAPSEPSLPPKAAAPPPPSSATATSTAPPPVNPNLRKSSRSTRAQNIDYANLDAHLPASVDRWIKTIAAREASGQIVDGFAGDGAFRRFEDGNELSAEGDEWVYGDKGMTEPFVVTKPEGLGLEMPERLTVKQVAELVGPKTPLEVIDCASQSSLANWTLGQWADYYEDPNRDKVRNVISLEVSDSRLGEMVTAPELVRKLDWVDTVWPADMKVPGQYPRVQKYCLMSVSRCWTDWHVDFAGSSVFYHVLRGGKTFFFIRPTQANLQAYEQWSGSAERQEQTWLGDMCDQVYRMDLEEGNTAFIPTGWIHAVYTPADSLVIGGNFLHSLNIPTQLRVYNIELATKVPRKFRYPHFVKLLWLVGKHYYERLSQHPADQPLPLSLRAPRVLDGLQELSSFLIEQTTRLAKGAQVSAERRRLARENIPAKKIPDPVWLSRELRKVVLKARGEPLDAECFLPHVAYVDEPALEAAATAGTKRKADSPLEMDANAALAALSRANKIRRPSAPASAPTLPGAGSFPAFPPPVAPAGGDGEIIGRQNLPVQTVTRTEERLDPRGAMPDAAVHAEVRESRSTQSVVRRWERDPLDPSGAGGPVVETRTVITIIERVRFPTAAQAALEAQQRMDQPYAYPSVQQQPPQQQAGVGPPAPQSVTALPGAPNQHVGTTNPEPYQPYGWPYQYQLASQGQGASVQRPPSANGLPVLPTPPGLATVTGAVPPQQTQYPPPPALAAAPASALAGQGQAQGLYAPPLPLQGTYGA